MPGTVQVSVIEFKGLPSTSTPSTFLKVSLGKREYQTSDTGDFSFPLTNLRDNLVVKLLDAEGNEIALTGIQTMSIVEKVSWDEIFPLDGGGHVHLKLQFILNEEERNRIRLKREAAVKKKQENISNISHKNLETAGSVGSSVTSPLQAEQKVAVSQTRTVLRVGSLDNVAILAGLLPNPDVSPAGLQPNYEREEGSILQQGIPKAMDKREGTFSTPNIHGTEAHQLASEEKLEIQPSVPKVDVHLVSGKEHSPDSTKTRSDVSKKSSLASLRLQDDHVDKYQKQGPLEKIPSKVRELVGAFESSQLKQDVKSAVKEPTVTSEPKEVGKGGHLKHSDPKDVKELAEPSSRRSNSPFVAGDSKPILSTSSERGENINSDNSSFRNMSYKVTETSEQLSVLTSRPVEKELGTSEWMESLAQLQRSTTEEASTSGRMHMDHSERAYSFRLSARKPYSGATSHAEGSRRTDSSKIDILVASIEKPKSLEYCEEENFYSENSGMWIFPNDMKRFCITTAGKRVMKLFGDGPTEAKFPQKKRSSSSSGDKIKHGSDYEMEKHQKESQSPRKSTSESSSNDASGGLVGQVIKIAIIVGFGVLVFFTRQREPRKSKRETNELFFTTSDYMDEQTTIAEQVD